MQQVSYNKDGTVTLSIRLYSFSEEDAEILRRILNEKRNELSPDDDGASRSNPALE